MQTDEFAGQKRNFAIFVILWLALQFVLNVAASLQRSHTDLEETGNISWRI